MLSRGEREFIRKFCADNYSANAALDDIDELLAASELAVVMLRVFRDTRKAGVSTMTLVEWQNVDRAIAETEFVRTKALASGQASCEH